MMKRQQGMTAIGWLIVLAIVGLFAIAAIRLVPVYLENVKVASVLKSVKLEFDGKKPTPQALRQAIRKRFDVDSVTAIKYSDVKIKREGDTFTVVADYEQRAKFLANLDWIATFNNQVEVRL